MDAAPTPLEWLVAGILAAGFVITVIVQLPGRWADRLREVDVFGLLPGWNFFAPNPGRVDYHLLFRDELPNGARTPWREIPLTRDRRWFHAFWNPERRLKKTVFDAAGAIAVELRAGSPDVRLSVGYLHLMNFVTAYRRVYPFRSTQFLLMVSTPAHDTEPLEIIMSHPHAP